MKRVLSLFGGDPGWFVALILPIIAILPTLNPDHIISTADGSFHIHRMVAVTTLLRQGDLYPRWIPWFHVGYGYPVLNFYAPLATYLGGAMGIFGISAPNASTLLLAISWTVGSTGMYALGRRYLNSYAGIMAALLWSYSPSTFQAVWNQGNLSQITAAALLPWLFYSLIAVIKNPSPRRSAVCALVLGLVILAHQPTTVLLALLVIPGVPLLCLWYGWGEGRLKQRLIFTIGGLVLGVGVSMIFLLPVVLELQYIQASQPAADIPQTLAHFILQPNQLFVQPQAPDMRDLNRNLPETVGIVSGLLALVGFGALIWRKKYRFALTCAGVGLLILLLAQAGSLPLWQASSLMAQLRFPGRILHIGRLFFALLGGASLLLLPSRLWKFALVGLAIIILVTALPMLYPSRPFLNFADLTPADEVRYEAETLSFGGTSYDEFKPIWGETTPKDQPNLDDIEAHPLRINVIDPGQQGTMVTQADDENIQVVSDHAFDLSFRQFYFPGWSVQVDGVAVNNFPSGKYGLLTASIPAGNHIVNVHRSLTAVEQIAPLLSLISLGLVGWLWRKSHSSLSETTPGLTPRFAAILAGGISIFALVNTLYIQPNTLWFRQLSPPDEPAYMLTAVHQRFGDAYELLGYSLHQNETQAGEAFDITLYWRALRPLSEKFKAVVQLVNPRVSEAWAVSENFYIADNGGQQTPDYFISDDHRLQVHSDVPPYVGRLLVQLVNNQTGEAVHLSDGSDKLLLDKNVRVQGGGIPAQKILNTVLDGKVELWCAAVQQKNGQLTVDLYWHVLEPLETPNVSVFVHGFDANNEIVALFDEPMFNGDYAATDWLPGQNLVDHLVVPVGAGLERLSVGMHLPSGDRLAVLTDGTPAPENRIWLPLDIASCKTS